MKFEKVSYEQFSKDFLEMLHECSKDMGVEKLCVTKDFIREIYDNIKLPQRATKGSAGYDFFSPFNIMFSYPEYHHASYYVEYVDSRHKGLGIKSLCLIGGVIKVPTGIRVKIDDNWLLSLYPRSGYGFKYRMALNNTVGIIDSDYYFSDNEGHIMAKINFDMDKNFNIKAGDAFIQGVFTPFGITEDDKATGIRNGGFGSTSQKQNEDVKSENKKEIIKENDIETYKKVLDSILSNSLVLKNTIECSPSCCPLCKENSTCDGSSESCKKYHCEDITRILKNIDSQK